MELIVNSKVKVKIRAIERGIGATFYWPNGEETYSEHQYLKDILNEAKRGQKIHA